MELLFIHTRTVNFMQIYSMKLSRIRHPVVKIGDLSNPEENVLGISYWKKASSFNFSSTIKNYIRNTIENSHPLQFLLRKF